MTRLEFPSDVFPAFPALAITAPDGWSPVNATDTVMAVALDDVQAGVFRPNVVVAVTRFAAGYVIDTAIDAVVAKFTSLQDYAELQRSPFQVLGSPGFVIEGSFVDPRAGTLFQGVMVAAIDRGPCVDLVQVTGTASAEQAREMWPVVRDIINSIVLAS